MTVQLPDVKTVALSKIKPYERNPRRIPQEAVDAVAQSITEYGYQQPIVVDEDMVIIVGHTRLQALQQLGVKRVPIYIAKGLSEEQVKEYRLVDNKTGEMTSWDHSALVLELREFESGLLESFFPNIDLEIGQIASATGVTQAEVEKAEQAIKRVKEAESILTTEVKCPSCFHTFKVRTDSLPGLSHDDLSEMRSSGASE